MKNTPQQFKAPLIVAVAGSVGKTTIVHIIHEVFRSSGIRSGFLSTSGICNDSININKEITAENINKKELLNQLSISAKNSLDIFVLEIKSEKIATKLYTDLVFDSGIITSIFGDDKHFKTWDSYAKTKIEFLKLVKDGGVVILNADESDSVNWIRLNSKHLKNNIYTYWASIKNITNLAYDIYGSKFTINGLANMQTKILGDFNLLNLYQATKLLSHYLPTNLVVDKISKISSPKGRFEKVLENPFSVFIDFGNTFLAIEKGIDFLNKQKKAGSNIITVIGLSSEHPESYLNSIGSAIKYTDILIITSNDPVKHHPSVLNDVLIKKSQSLANINVLERFNSTEEFNASEISKLIQTAKNMKNSGILPVIVFDHDDFTGRLDAIKFAILASSENDQVYITGKGDSNVVRYSKVEYEWSDLEALKIAMEVRSTFKY